MVRPSDVTMPNEELLRPNLIQAAFRSRHTTCAVIFYLLQSLSSACTSNCTVVVYLVQYSAVRGDYRLDTLVALAVHGS